MSPGGSKIPPEEKLLKLIRGKPQAAGPAAVVAGAGGSVAAIGSARGRGGSPGWLVPMVNALLLVVAVAEVGALVWLTIAPVPEPSVAVPVATEAVPAAAPPAEPMPLVSAAVTRPLFEIPERRAAEPADGGRAAAPSDQELQGMTAQLTLIGVVSGDPPQAIIEDAQSQKTSFVSAGQSVRGLVVEEVHEDRVILNVNGKKVVLSL